MWCNVICGVVRGMTAAFVQRRGCATNGEVGGEGGGRIGDLFDAGAVLCAGGVCCVQEVEVSG